MKSRFFNKLRKILLSFLEFFGVSAFLGCDFNTIISHLIDSPVMYGSPGNSVRITGTVYGDIDGDGTKEIVPGVKVTVEPVEKDNNSYNSFNEEDNEEEDLYYENSSKQFTDKEGKFKVEYYDWSETKFKYTVTIEDIDGEENGSFKDKTIEVDVSSDKERSEKATWGIIIDKDLGKIDLENNE